MRRLAPSVFVTDASYPNCLAAIRALARAGAVVTAGERDSMTCRATIGFWSRFCSHRFWYPDPAKNPQAAASALEEYFSKNTFDAVIPIGLEMTAFFIQHAGRFRVPTMLPGAESFAIAGDKSKTFQFAESAGVRIPRTFFAADYRHAGLPCVFKHPRTGVLIAQSRPEAEAIVSRLGSELCRYVVQEFIPGRNGFGYFGFYVDGVEHGYFMHERLMQFPIEGGPSVEARSFYDEKLHDAGRRVLTGLKWHGVAMVEFKRSDSDGEYYLMEVNPKFWGSLDLAIQSGCNFPVWVLNYILRRTCETPGSYDQRTHYQWVVPNGVKCFLRYRDYRGTFLAHLLDPRVRKDVAITDPLPTLAGLASMAGHLVRP